jgi:hypothetical protein
MDGNENCESRNSQINIKKEEEKYNKMHGSLCGNSIGTKDNYNES